jgi:hypothetical protein
MGRKEKKNRNDKKTPSLSSACQCEEECVGIVKSYPPFLPTRM